MTFVDILRGVFALAVTLGLVGLAAWAVRRYAPSALARMQGASGPRRLAIVESLMLDPQRRLVLVRLDKRERLLLLGEGRLIAEGPAREAPAPKTGAAS